MLRDPRFLKAQPPSPAEMFWMRAWMDASNSMRGRASRKSSLSVQKWELLLESPPSNRPCRDSTKSYIFSPV